MYTCSVLLTNILHFKLCVCVFRCFSRVQPFVTPWTVACQAPHGILQARVSEWVAMPSSRGSSWLGFNPHLLHLRWILYRWATREAPYVVDVTYFVIQCKKQNSPRVTNISGDKKMENVLMLLSFFCNYQLKDWFPICKQKNLRFYLLVTYSRYSEREVK